MDITEQTYIFFTENCKKSVLAGHIMQSMKGRYALKRISLSLLGFFAWIVIVAREGFLIHAPIQKTTLIVSIAGFIFLLFIFLKKSAFSTIVLFLVSLSALALTVPFFANTYDTSWDGQGYHQSAVIALKEGWNPLYQSDINFEKRLPSQIFAESYPDALWEIQASIYALTNNVNSAKVMNLAIAVVSFSVVYVLLRKINIGIIASLSISGLVVIQPLFVIQFLTFMQDGFGYQLVVIASASLVYWILDNNSVWGLTTFLLSIIFLASSKYSHLPMVLILGGIFILVLANRFLNKLQKINRSTIMYSVGLLVVSLIFAYIPYGRNAIFHHSPFYPTNVTELNGSVVYNNLPHNLKDKGKLVQFFYGIFSASQVAESSDNRSEANVVYLKTPFTFSFDEISNAAFLYNNRAGAAGPLFSGILILAALFCFVMSFRATTMKQKYVFYAIYFSVGVIVLVSIMVPTPNLIRYVSQIQLLPFLFFVPLLAIFKSASVKVVSSVLIVLLFINNFLYAAFVVRKDINEQEQINTQLTSMQSSGLVYPIKAQQFYSNYTLLSEHNVRFVIEDNLPCTQPERLYASSTTTQFCPHTTLSVR